MLTAIAAMFAGVLAWFAAPYVIIAGIFVWLLLHKIALAGFIVLFFLIIGVARVIPAIATQVLAGLSVLAIMIGWNVYTPDSNESPSLSSTPATVAEATASPSPTPEATASPVAVTTPTPTPGSIWTKEEIDNYFKPTPTPKHGKHLSRKEAAQKISDTQSASMRSLQNE
jgi:hypothetical protein